MRKSDLIIFSFLLFMLAASIAAFFFLKYHKKKARPDRSLRSKKQSKANRYYMIGRFFQNLPLINRFYLKIREQVALIEPGDIVTINATATGIMLRSLEKSALVVLLAVILAGGDLYFTIAGILIAYIIFVQSARNATNKMEIRMLDEFSNFLADIRHYYHDKRLVDDAIAMTFDDLSYNMSLHIQRIYDLLKSPDPKLEVERYAQSSPNRFFTTFVSICVSISDYGDKEMENGASLFLRNLNYLKEEVQMELLRKRNIDYLFKSLVTVSIFPIIFIKPIEYWARFIMEGMENIYNGIYGLVAMLVIFLITFVCYTLVCIYKDDQRGRIIESSIWSRLSAKQPVSGLLNREINHHYTKNLRLDTQLKETGDQTGPKAFLLRRIVYGLCGGLLVFLVTASIPSYQRSNLRENFSESFNAMNVADESFIAVMEEVAKLKLEEFEKIGVQKEDLISNIMETTELTQPSYAELVADEVLERMGRLDKTYYKFYYLLFAALGFLAGFCIPRLFLSYNLKASQMGKEDEVNQFQTLMLIFMHADGITLRDILEWMERFAFSFKSSITECVMSLPFGEQKALIAMRDKEKHFAPFKRFADNLIAIDSVGIVAAFDEITTERDYYKEKRRLDNMELARKKASKARIAAFIPLFSVIGLYLLIPIIMAAVQLLLTLYSSIY